MATKTKKKRLVLLDTHVILHRAYHALPDFVSQKGEPTGALYGLSTMLMKLIKDLEPDYVVACFDLPKPTYRHEVYEGYKAGRAKTDDSLVEQITRSRDVLEAFAVPIYEKEGFEADDILGTIVDNVKNKKDVEVVIATGDMDTLQLVDKKKVRVFTLKKGIKDTVLYDEDAVHERYSFGPELLPDYKGLRGDPSDNIPGIKGIGEKTATTLITSFGSLEDMYKKLEADEQAFLDVGIKPRIIGLLKDNKDEAFFSKMLGLIRRDAPIDFSIPQKPWEEAFDPQTVIELFKELSFRSLVDRVSKDYGVLVSNDTHSEDEEPQEKEDVPEEEAEKVILALWLLNADNTNSDLDDVYDYAKTNSFKEARGTILADLKKNDLESVYKDIELPLIALTKEMHERGIKIDTAFLATLSKKYHTSLTKIQKLIWKHAGREFNINSPKQLGEILFDELEISTKGIKKTSTGARSTRESELEKLKDVHPIIEEILAYRELQKLLSTYIDNIPGMVADDGRLHATFLQMGAGTGRMSSNHPNLQNIPIRKELGRPIRNAFIAEKGYKLVAIDYSQIELRIAAMLSGDKKLLDIFKRGDDIHASVAADVFDVKQDEVTKEMRSHAKTINFGILYGMGVNALKKNLGTTRQEAQQFYNAYFATYSELANYLQNTKNEAAAKGYTTTYFGRKRYFEGIHSNIPFIRASAERMALNAPIQGTQADIVKLAMSKIDTYLQSKKLKEEVRLLLQVHDELVYEIKEDLIKSIVPKIKEIMESIVSPKETGGITFVANAAVGDNWGEMNSL